MSTSFELMDLDSGNFVGSYETLEEALEVIHDAYSAYGQSGINDLGLARVEGSGSQRCIASGAELIDYVVARARRHTRRGRPGRPRSTDSGVLPRSPRLRRHEAAPEPLWWRLGHDRRERAMRRYALLVVVVLLLTGGGISPVSAQDATPVPGLIVPEPAECTIVPRSLNEFAALLATPAAVSETAATPTPITIPLGQPADDATIAEITRTARETFACFSAGDYLRVFALVTDDAVRQLQAQGILSAEVVPFFAATPVAVPSELRAGYLALTDIVVLPDGRVGAFIVEVDPTLPPEGAETDYLVFERVGDRWLIDEIVETWTAAGPGGAGTPTP